MKKNIQELKYKCLKCGKDFSLKEMTEVKKHFPNGSILTQYLCKECNKEKESLKKGE